MHKLHLLVLFFSFVLFSDDSSWCVMLGEVYHASDKAVNQQLQNIRRDSLSFFEMHMCQDIASREYFTLIDSLVPGVYIGEPEAFYSSDSLPSADYKLWLSVADSSIALLLSERYGGQASKDTTGNGPGLPGEWNILLPKLFEERSDAMQFLASVQKEVGAVSLGYALITAGEYLFFGSCLTKDEARSLMGKLQKYKLSIYVCQVQYQHIDI